MDPLAHHHQQQQQLPPPQLPPMQQQFIQPPHPSAPSSQVPISVLAHRVVQNLYKTLHALLDTLSGSNITPHQRRIELYNYALKSLYSIIRLLVNIRWSMDYNAFHMSATRALMLARQRMGDVEGGADRLFYSYDGVVRGAKMGDIDVEGSVAVVETGGKVGLPRNIVENVVGAEAVDFFEDDNLDDDDNDDANSEVFVRLASVTRWLVKLGLGVSPHTKVLRWETDPSSNFGVAVGVKGVWSATLIATSLDLTKAALRVREVKVHVGARSDNPDQSAESLSVLRGEQEQALMELIDGRVFWSTSDIEPSVTVTEAERDAVVKNRAKAMMRTIVEVMNSEITGPLVIELLRREALKILRIRRGFIELESPVPERSANIYGQKLEQEDTARPEFTLTLWKGQKQFQVRIVGGDVEGKPVDVVHTPKLDNSQLYRIPLQDISLEAYLLTISMERARLLLHDIKKRLSEEVSDYQKPVSPRGSSDTDPSCFITPILCADGIIPPRLLFPLQQLDGGKTPWHRKAILELSIDVWTGSFKLRTLGKYRFPSKLALSVGASAENEGRAIMLNGNNARVAQSLKTMLRWASAVMQSDEVERCFYSCDLAYFRAMMTKRSTLNSIEGGRDVLLKNFTDILSFLQFYKKLCNVGDGRFEEMRTSKSSKQAPARELSSSRGRNLSSVSHQSLASLGFDEVEEDLQPGFSARKIATTLLYVDYTTILTKTSMILRALSKRNLMDAEEEDGNLTYPCASDVKLTDLLRSGKLVLREKDYRTLTLPTCSYSISIAVNGNWRFSIELQPPADKKSGVSTIEKWFGTKQLQKDHLTLNANEISLSYRDFSYSDLKAYFTDLNRIRGICCLQNGVFSKLADAKHFRIVESSWDHLIVGVRFERAQSSLFANIQLKVWFEDYKLQVDCTPDMADQHYIEELLNASRSRSGHILVSLLHIAIPLGVAAEAFRKTMKGRIKASTCLCLRIEWPNVLNPKGVLGLKIDGTNVSKSSNSKSLPQGQECRRVVVIDLGGVGRKGYDRISGWQSILKLLKQLETRFEEPRDSIIVIEIDRLPELFKAIIRYFRAALSKLKKKPQQTMPTSVANHVVT